VNNRLDFTSGFSKSGNDGVRTERPKSTTNRYKVNRLQVNDLFTLILKHQAISAAHSME
jgi:hypothetical protein